MIEAHSLEGIKNHVANTLSRQIMNKKREKSKGSISPLEFMTTPVTERPIIDQIEQVHITTESKLVGILFCNPFSNMGKDEIVPHLPYFHYRSGIMSDFFCVGYGAYWPTNHYADQTPVVNIEGTNWLFSEKAFNSIRYDIENECSWKYSGETELILVSIQKCNHEVYIDFNTAIACNLEQMQKDGAFNSVRSFFENIFRFAENYTGRRPIWDLSDSEGISQGKKHLLNGVLSLLPDQLCEAYKTTRHYAVTDLRKKP